MIIAIDGPAGVGKSSIAQKCAERLSFRYINSGLLYRIIAIKLSAHSGHAMQYSDAIHAIHSESLKVDYQVYTDTAHLYKQCYSNTIDEHVGAISAILKVRQLVGATIELLKKGHNCIIEGRDIATVVCKNADLKIYLDADIEVRAQRRAMQRNIKYDDALRNIKTRDMMDRDREEEYLNIAENIIIINITRLTFIESCAIIYKYIMDLLDK